jgi:hypothetical protein
VQPRHRAPPPHQESTEQHERDERDVKNDNGARQNAKHGSVYRAMLFQFFAR